MSEKRDISQIYDEKFFSDYSGTQVDDIRTIAEHLFTVFGPKKCIDVGAGPGVLIQRLHEMGCKVSGVDGSIHALTKADSDISDYLSLVDITDSSTSLTGQTYELVICTEVAEHIPFEFANVLVQKLCNACVLNGEIVFTAARPNQGGHDHVNEQPLNYWIEKFRIRGFEVDENKTTALRHAWSAVTRMWWYGSNAVVFYRARHDAVQVLECPKTRTDLVSVVVPCYRQAKYLNQSLGSIRLQTYPNTEVFIACGDSESVHAANAFLDRSGEWGERVTILSDLNRGLADARNRSIEQASGQYIACLDADDLWSPSYIEKAIQALPESSSLSIATCDMQYFGDRRDALSLGEYSETKILEACYLLVCSLYSKRLWKLVGGYENAIFGYEDWHFWMKCSKHKPIVCHIGERLFHYRVHAHQGSNLCVRNDSTLKAAIRLMEPDLFPAYQRTAEEDLALASDEAREKLLERATWFPANAYASRFKQIMDKVQT